MTVALSSLRVVTEGDSSSYVKSMADVAKASDDATASVGKFTDAQGQQLTYLSRTSDAFGNATSRFERLQRSLDPAYASEVKLAQAHGTLQGALDRGAISTDRYNELMALAGARFEDVGKKASPLSKVFEGVSAQLIALSAGAGPVGVALAAFGPIGFAASVGLGAATAAIDYLIKESDRFGEAASKMHDFAETAGITSTQLQALQHAGAGVGLTTDVLQQSFERFSVQLSEMQKGTGSFYTELLKVSPELTRQLAVTKDAAKAWDVLAEAYANADIRQQALIAHAAFGRGGAGTGRLLSATAEGGGIAGLQSKVSPAGLIGDEEIQRVGALKTVLDQTRAITQNIWASMFSEDVLQKQLRAAQAMKEIAEHAKEIYQADKGKSWLERVLDSAIQLDAGAIGERAPTTPVDAMAAARARVASGLTSNALTGNRGTDWERSVYEPPAASEQGPQQPSAAFIASQAKATVAALGSAATAYEQQKVKILELDVELKNNTITQTTYNRAVAGLKLDTVIAMEGQRLGLLGELAPVMEIAGQKENQIRAAREKGVSITDAEAKSIKFLTEVQTESARLQEKITIGTASESEIRANLAKVLEEYKTKKLFDPNDPLQLAAANVTLGKSFERMSEQAQLARAPLEGLKKLEQDSGNLRLQVDQTSVAALNQMTTSLTDFGTGSKTASLAFQDFGKAIIKMLEEMLIKMLVVLPIARALQNTLGPMVGGGGGIPTSNPYSGMPAGSNPTFGHTGGMVSELTTGRYVHPAYFENAPRLHTGMLSADEMPAILRKDESVLTPGQMGAMLRAGAAMGGGGKTQVNVYNQADGTSAKTSTRRSGGVDITDIVISAVGSHMARGGYDTILKARTGTKKQPFGR